MGALRAFAHVTALCFSWGFLGFLAWTGELEIIYFQFERLKQLLNSSHGGCCQMAVFYITLLLLTVYVPL